jgi:RNA polymerase sigma-70 factor, ECF subfamily
MAIYPTSSKLSPELPGQGLSIWSNVVKGVERGDACAMEELYKVFSKGIRFLLHRQLGPQDLDDKVHDVFVIITQAIRNGELREPERLMGYVYTVVRRQVASHIDRAIHLRRNRVDVDFENITSDKRPDPEREAINRQNLNFAMNVLQSIPKRDREVLTRFYLNEEPVEEICRAMDLSESQFRLIKSRAKARFGERGSRRVALRSRLRVA